MRIPDKFLEHRVILEAIKPIGSSTGAKFQPARSGVKAIVMDKRTRVVDQRVASETKGQEILVSGHVLLHKENWIPPGSLVTVWPGTTMERKAEVVASAYGDHSIAPESAQVWIV